MRQRAICSLQTASGTHNEKETAALQRGCTDVTADDVSEENTSIKQPPRVEASGLHGHGACRVLFPSQLRFHSY